MNQALLDLAKLLAREGGAIAWEGFISGTRTGSLKSDRSYLSYYDTKVEDYIREGILARYPDHALFGEEQGHFGSDSAYTWYIDPIDGTTNFTLGIPLFCTIISVAKNNIPVAAAIYVPCLDSLFWAAKDKGAYCNDTRLLQHSSASLNEITLQIEWNRNSTVANKALGFISDNAQYFRSIRRFGSFASMCLHLQSDSPLVLLFFQQNQPYETMAAYLILKEVGYIVVDHTGEDWLEGDQTILLGCSHEQMAQMTPMLITTSGDEV